MKQYASVVLCVLVFHTVAFGMMKTQQTAVSLVEKSAADNDWQAYLKQLKENLAPLNPKQRVEYLHTLVSKTPTHSRQNLNTFLRTVCICCNNEGAKKIMVRCCHEEMCQSCFSNRKIRCFNCGEPSAD